MTYKPFDIEASKRGEPVMLSDGSEARVICYDANGKYPIVVLLGHPDGFEYSVGFSVDGGYNDLDFENTPEDEKLVMKPLCIIEDTPVYAGAVLYKIYDKEEFIVRGSTGYCLFNNNKQICLPEGLTWYKPKQKKSGWVVIYKDGSVSSIKNSKEHAERFCNFTPVAVTEIHWEE